MTPKKRLGRGLDALLSKPCGRGGSSGSAAADGLKHMPVELLQRGQYQPRVDMRQDSLEDLASSIKAQGVVQPIVARPHSAKTAERNATRSSPASAAGAPRRWPACGDSGSIRDVPDEAAIAMALIENIQRENLNPLEEARALDRLIREFDLTHAEAAKRLAARARRSATCCGCRTCRTRSSHCSRHGSSKWATRARCWRSATRRSSLMRRARSSRRACRFGRPSGSSSSMLAGGKTSPAKTAGGRRGYSPPRNRGLREAGRQSQRRSHEKGAGKLVISYNSLDELDGILKHITLGPGRL